MWDRTKDTMILTKLCFLWTLWLPDIVPQTCDEIPSLNADDVTILLPFTSHSWHQPQVSSDHKKWRMNHCFLQTHNCNWAVSCCRWGLVACSHHGALVANHHPCCLWLKCHSIDVYSGAWWLDDTDDDMGLVTGQQAQVAGVQGDRDIQCREHFRYMQPVWQVYSEPEKLCTDQTYQAALLPRPWDTCILRPWKNRIVAIMDFLQPFLSACFKRVLTAYHLAKTEERCKAPFILTHIFCDGE